MFSRAPSASSASSGELSRKKLLSVLGGETLTPPPIWLMRQAGRYLPEYRAIRAKAGSFLDLCYSPDLAVEVTLQPIRRYAFDAAILFSDILVVPHGLGQAVSFTEGSGPRLDPLRASEDLLRLDINNMLPRLAPVYETVARLRAQLPKETALIGFAGAPWTVASYMIEGGSSRDFQLAKDWTRDPSDKFQKLVDILVEATAAHLSAQVDAGADLLQIFDSWAGALDHPGIRQWSLEPIRRIVSILRTRHPHIPIIVFPRGIGEGYIDFAEAGFADGLSLDSGIALDWAQKELRGPRRLTLQGNLDPQILVAGGAAMLHAVDAICQTLSQGPFIFNLGHGILPQTPPEHVEALVRHVRNFRG